MNSTVPVHNHNGKFGAAEWSVVIFIAIIPSLIIIAIYTRSLLILLRQQRNNSIYAENR
jgi:hypothetical protein